ncbi:Lrp/AsnC family transcriptional regulator [Rhodococcus erythropolis]|uniref:Lrp/AsnC family transcriptional regulator n=1 Tax=Rhodococcus erythropolis TaxID=1833 RepID=UPI00366CD972
MNNYTQTQDVLDETDLALIDALQVNPRSSWLQLGDALGIAPITLARRWERLRNSGAAWVSITQPPEKSRGAVIELSCTPQSEMAVARHIAQLPYISTVGITTGDYQVYANLLAPTLSATTHALLQSISLPADVTRMRSHVFGSMFGGIQWRLGVLNRAQTDLLRDPAAQSTRQSRPFGPQDRDLFLALAEDGRRAYTDLAEELNSSVHGIRRRVRDLLSQGEITFRCDAARSLSGWHTMALLWLSVPDQDLRTMGKDISTWEETRQCSAVVGAVNLLLIVNLRSFEHLEQIATRIRDRHPSAQIVDRRLVIRQVKVYGRLVDQQGRSTHTIPVDAWPPELLSTNHP